MTAACSRMLAVPPRWLADVRRGESVEGKDETRQRIIVAAVDDSVASAWAVRWAADETTMHDSSLILAHVINPAKFSTPDRETTQSLLRSEKRLAHDVLTRARHIATDRIGSPSTVPIRTEIAYGAIVSTLSTLAPHTWMIAVGSRRRHSWGGRRLGSVAAGSCRHATSSVAVVHSEPTTEQRSRPVVVGIDGSGGSHYAAGLAFEEASGRNVPLVAVHAWRDIGALASPEADRWTGREAGEEMLRDFLAPWQRCYPDVVVRRRLFCDRPAHWLLTEARQAGLVVVGTRDRGGLESTVLGSVATAVATESPAPVIVARAPR